MKQHDREGVMFGIWEIGFVFLCEEHLRKWLEGSKGILKMLWRYRLIPGRCLGEPERCRGEGLRCAATRTRTLRTSVVAGSANLEKTGCFIVNTGNWWPVFWCTVNWSRARHRSTFIAGGAQRSSSFYAVRVRNCVVADEKNIVYRRMAT